MTADSKKLIQMLRAKLEGSVPSTNRIRINKEEAKEIIEVLESSVTNNAVRKVKSIRSYTLDGDEWIPKKSVLEILAAQSPEVQT